MEGYISLLLLSYPSLYFTHNLFIIAIVYILTDCIFVPIFSVLEERTFTFIDKIMIATGIDITGTIDTIIAHMIVIIMLLIDTKTQKIVCIMPGGQVSLGIRRRSHRERWEAVLKTLSHIATEYYVFMMFEIRQQTLYKFCDIIIRDFQHISDVMYHTIVDNYLH